MRLKAKVTNNKNSIDKYIKNCINKILVFVKIRLEKKYG